MSNTKEYEAANLLLPLQNTAKVISFYGAVAGPTTQCLGLASMFGDWSKHFYTLVADGGKIYAALSSSPTGTIDPGAVNATGIPTNPGFPIADQARLDGNAVGGRPVGMTGPGTGTPTFLGYQFLLFRTASGVGSATFQVWRSSVGPGAGIEEFAPAGTKRGHYGDG